MTFYFKKHGVRSDQEFIYTIPITTIENHMGCWLWQGRTQNGYGKVQFNTNEIKGSRRVHREAYRIFIGEIPEGLLIRHRCHNRLCCNPLHLEPGTDKENWQDAVVDGNAMIAEQDGSDNIMSKLSEALVYEIRTLFRSGVYSSTDLAEMFSVSRRCVERTIVGKAYSCYQTVPSYDWRDLPVDTFRGMLTKQGKAKIQELYSSGMTQVEIIRTTSFTRRMVFRVLTLDDHMRI